MTSKRSSPSSAEGFSLVELLLAASLMLAVAAVTFPLAVAALRLFDADRERTQTNQGLKAARDFLGLDVRQAGERLPSDFPAVEIVRGEELPGGSAGDPDRLVLRRNLVSTVLRSCRAVSGSERKIYIAELVDPPPPGCVAVPDDNGDGWPDNHGAWHDHRLAEGVLLEDSKFVWAYLYNPVTRDGEFFRYWRDDEDQAYIETPTGQSWTYDYPVVEQARVYLLEERRYGLNGDTMQIVVNEVGDDAINIAGDIVDFQLLAHLEGQAPTDDLGPAAAWMDLRGIEIALQGRRLHGDKTVDRLLTTTLTPRNVMSR